MREICKKRKLNAYLIILTASLLSFVLSFMPPFSTLVISPLIIAIIFGILLGNTTHNVTSFLEKSDATKVATKEILRLGIILYGFKITISDILNVGFSGIMMAFFIVFSTFFIGKFLRKKLGLSKNESTLISAGSAICGAAAVLATKSVVDAKSEETAVAIATVVLFGTFAMFLYPILFKFDILGLNLDQMGYMIGLSIHEVAHAVGAGAAVGKMDLAVLTKMLRVLMLVPFLFMLGVFATKSQAKKGSMIVPWFALWFLVAVFAGSFLPINFRNESFLPIVNFVSTILLSMAMFCLGLSITKQMLKKAGKKPFILAFILFGWLFIASFTLVYFLT